MYNTRKMELRETKMTFFYKLRSCVILKKQKVILNIGQDEREKKKSITKDRAFNFI